MKLSDDQLDVLLKRLHLANARKIWSRLVEQAEKERDEYRRVYLALLEAYRKLEMGLLGQKRERFTEAEPKEEIPFMVGQVVEITEGPFSDFSGTVEEVLAAGRRLASDPRQARQASLGLPSALEQWSMLLAKK